MSGADCRGAAKAANAKIVGTAFVFFGIKTLFFAYIKREKGVFP